MMTRLEALQRVVASCDRRLERQLEDAELLLADLGGTREEIAAAVGPNGYFRAMVCADHAQDIAATARWLVGGDETRH